MLMLHTNRWDTKESASWSCRFLLFIACLVLVTTSSANAFVIFTNKGGAKNICRYQNQQQLPSSIIMAATGGGFGGGGGGGKSRNKKKKSKKNASGNTSEAIKLKPKQQWDRYSSLKKEQRVPVAIRATRESDDEEEWLEVGRVKSKDNAYTEIAVARQRGLLAEHAKRLFPLQISGKETLQWAYIESDSTPEDSAWIQVNKSILDEKSVPDGIEKIIGFEGIPDPGTGFYCNYEGGRIQK